MHQKRTAESSRAELELREVYELISEIKDELKKIKAIADDALVKAHISHSLIVVRKISEDKVAELEQIIG